MIAVSVREDGIEKVRLSALLGYKRVKETPVRRQENKKIPIWESRQEMVWSLTGIAEVSYR